MSGTNVSQSWGLWNRDLPQTNWRSITRTWMRFFRVFTEHHSSWTGTQIPSPACGTARSPSAHLTTVHMQARCIVLNVCKAWFVLFECPDKLNSFEGSRDVGNTDVMCGNVAAKRVILMRTLLFRSCWPIGMWMRMLISHLRPLEYTWVDYVARMEEVVSRPNLSKFVILSCELSCWMSENRLAIRIWKFTACEKISSRQWLRQVNLLVNVDQRRLAYRRGVSVIRRCWGSRRKKIGVVSSVSIAMILGKGSTRYAKWKEVTTLPELRWMCLRSMLTLCLCLARRTIFEIWDAC